MKCGFGRAKITPTEPAELAGYGPNLHRVFDTVHDDLWVRALALDGGTGTYVLIQVDVTEMGREMVEGAMKRIRDRLPVEAVPHVVCAPIHTHNAPVVMVTNAWGEFSEVYTEYASTQMAQAAFDAVMDLWPCTVEYGENRVPEIAFNRAHLNEPWDDGLQIIRFVRDGVKSITLFSAAVHPVTIDQRGSLGLSVSADWPGVTMAKLERVTNDHAMFVMGTSGDADPVVAWHMFGFEGAELTGTLVADRVLTALQHTERMEGSIHTGAIQISLPLQWPIDPIRLKALAQAEVERHSTVENRETWQQFYDHWRQQLMEWTEPMVECEASYISIGKGLAIVSLPGEVFSSIGKSIRAESPFRHVIFNTIVGESIGYIPDERDYANHGYASFLSPAIMGYPLYREDVGSALRAGLKTFWAEEFVDSDQD